MWRTKEECILCTHFSVASSDMTYPAHVGWGYEKSRLNPVGVHIMSCRYSFGLGI